MIKYKKLDALHTQLMHEKADLLEELKRLIDAMKALGSSSIYENEIYDELEISELLINHIEGKEDGNTER